MADDNAILDTERLDESDEPEQGEASWWQQLLAVIVALAVLAGLGLVAVFLFNAIAPDKVPERSNPNFIDNVFDSAIVIGAARILLMAAAGLLLVFAAYTVTSMVVRMKNGEWLKEGGPFKADIAEAESFLEEAQNYFEALVEQVNENEGLVERLKERDSELEQLIDENQRLRAMVDPANQSE